MKVEPLMAARKLKRGELLEHALNFYQRSPIPNTKGFEYDLWRIGKYLAGHEGGQSDGATPRPPIPMPVRIERTPYIPPPPPAARPKKFVLPHQAEISTYIRIIIDALEEAIEYEPKRHHNKPPPALRLDDPHYIAELKNLVNELKRLNNVLEKLATKKEKKAVVVKLARHFDKFLATYSTALGKGAAGLTVAALAGLLLEIGVGQNVIRQILSHFKF